MPPFKGLPKSESAARDQGLVTLTSFFTVKQSRGRPTKKTSNAGRPASEKTATPTDPVPVPPAATLKPNKEKAKRMSYSSGEGLEKMTGAVKAWEDEQRKPAEQQMSMKKFAKAWEIPFSTLQNHVCPDDSKRIKLGSSVGKTPIIGSAEQKVIVDVLIRKDRANKGVGVDVGVGNVAPEVAAAVAAQPPVTYGLETFQLKPERLRNTGLPLFEHVVDFGRRNSTQKLPSAYLGVEVSKDQVEILVPSEKDLLIGAIIKDAGGEGATKKLAKRKLNNTGAITNHCGVQNNPARLKKLKDALELTSSLAEISALSKANKDKDKRKTDTELMDSAPAALQKLNRLNGDVAKITKKEICAISFRFFGRMYKEVDAKPTLMAGLTGLIAEQPDVLLEAAASSAVATGDPIPTLTPATAAGSAGEAESETEEGV